MPAARGNRPDISDGDDCGVGCCRIGLFAAAAADRRSGAKAGREKLDVITDRRRGASAGCIASRRARVTLCIIRVRS